jgi:5,10-methylenetetrahydromethanopterin reductase
MFTAGAWLFPDGPVDKLVRICQLLEETGFEYAWVGDEGLNRDCYVAITAILLATKRIKVGPGITNPYSRHPAVSAGAVATLDELSGGRAFLGFGPGSYANLSPIGLGWERPLHALREAIQVARLVFSGQVANFDGQLFKLRAARASYARPGIEVHLAGRGRQVLELGGELCDGVLLSGKATFDLEPTIAHIRTGAGRSGNRPKVFYAGDACFDEATLERSRMAHVQVIRNSPQYVKDHIDFTPEIEGVVAEWLRRGQPEEAARCISDEMLDEFVCRGDGPAVAAQIRALMAKHGMDVFVASLDSSLDLGRVHELAEVVRMAVG